MKTKIICTLGPSSESSEILEKLVTGGLDILRFNFSHTTEDQFNKVQKLIQKYNKKHSKNVKLMIDLQGPRLRIGELPKDGVMLNEGEFVSLSTNPNNKDSIYIKDPYLHEDIQVNHSIFLANGDFELFVTEKIGDVFKAKVIRGGLLHSRKGVNLPDTNLRTVGLTNKDLKDIEFGVNKNIDYIALSFVSNENDVLTLRKKIGDRKIKVISKIERKQALVNLEEIVKESDAVMIARGDLGVEVPLEEIPIIQKEIIKKCNERSVPVMVATQMLMSMVNHHRPTRAEVTDVANAVIDGAWGVMLSDETAYGKFPVRSLDYLVKTVQKAEEYTKINS